MYIQVFLFLSFKRLILRHMIFLIDFVSLLIFFKKQNWMKTCKILKSHTNLSLTILYKKQFLSTNAITTKNLLIKISTINELKCKTGFFFDFFLVWYENNIFLTFLYNFQWRFRSRNFFWLVFFFCVVVAVIDVNTAVWRFFLNAFFGYIVNMHEFSEPVSCFVDWLKFWLIFNSWYCLFIIYKVWLYNYCIICNRWQTKSQRNNMFKWWNKL